MPTNIREKLNQYRNTTQQYVASLRDIRNAGLLAFVVIVLLISWSGIKIIQDNYGLEKQISKLQQEDDVQKLQNTNMQLQNQYLTTDQYLEVTARQNLGLAAPGETELLVPKSVAMAHTVKQPATSPGQQLAPAQSFWQRNIGAWMDFFLHRSASV